GCRRAAWPGYRAFRRAGRSCRPRDGAFTMDTRRLWRTGGTLLGASLFAVLATGPAYAAITEIQPGDLAGAATRPYNGPADPILHFTGGDGNPTTAQVATALGYTGPVDASHCTRVDPPAPGGGTVFVNGVVFNY